MSSAFLESLMQDRTKNRLLVRTVVGQVRQSTYDLPQDGHVYGYARTRDRENAKQVTMSWQYHQNSQARQATRDFKELNKLSLRDKCVQAKAVAQFRRDVDVREKVREGRQGVELVLPAEDFRYGKANKPSTPMYDVMGFEYANRAEQVRAQQLQSRLELEKEKRRQVRLTNALRISQTAKNTPLAKNSQASFDNNGGANNDDFKLSRFRNVPSKVRDILRPIGASSTASINGGFVSPSQQNANAISKTLEVQ